GGGRFEADSPTVVQCAPAECQPIATSQRRSRMEYVVLNGIEALENAQAAAYYQTQLPAGAPRQVQGQRRTPQQKVPCTVHLKAHELPPCGGADLAGKVVGVDAKACKVGKRQIKPTLVCIDCDVLP